MACPYFEPERHRGEAKALLPLRDFWSGVCRAVAGAPFEPDERLLSECCNMGYARGKCTRFPEGPGPDAVRFTIVSDCGEVIRVSFAAERDHLPHSQGALEYSRSSDSLIGGHPGWLIEPQARAYLASYLRRKPAAA